MLTQLAAATAAKGTNLPTSGGIFLVREFRPKAVTSAPDVAHTYENANCSFGIGFFPDLKQVK